MYTNDSLKPMSQSGQGIDYFSFVRSKLITRIRGIKPMT